MATSAFKSSTRRSPVGASSPSDAGSSNRSGQHRRSRSLSRFSGRFPPSDPDGENPKGRFVNTVRGSAFPEISLDDLANEFFLATEDEERPVEESVRGRSGRRFSLAGGPPKEGLASSDASQRRGRSVSRSHGNGNFDNNLGLKGVSDVGSRRRRSVSVARYKRSVSEIGMDQYNNRRHLSKSVNFGNENFQRSTLPKPTASYHDGGVTRSLRRKDLLQFHDSDSSFSSALTDDEAWDVHHKNGFEKTIRAVYAQKKAEYPAGDGEGNVLYEAVRKEVWHAVEEIKTQLKQRRHDRTRMEKHLSEEAEKYFKDFFSNVEDTEFSSFNAEKSDSSSTVGRIVKLSKPEQRCTKTKKCESLALPDSLSVEVDGVVFPWLKWESNDDPSLSYKSKELVVPINPLLDTAQGWRTKSHTIESSVSSHVSFYGCDCSTAVSRDKMDSRFTESRSCSSQCATNRLGASLFDMDNYLNLQQAEDLLFERLRQRKIIDSGGLLLCHRTLI